jgi:hypothetical protein
MRTHVARHRLVGTAATAVAAVVLLAACNQPPGTPATGPSPSSTVKPLSFGPGTTLVADGTSTVSIGGKAVTFPTKVSEPSWSPDGSRIAFVDGDGNIATARPDGTGLLVLTTAMSGVARSHPTWQDSTVVYGYQAAGSASTLMGVFANGGSVAHEATQGEFAANPIPDQDPSKPGPVLSAPSGAPTTAGGEELAFQVNSGASGEVWVADHNGRMPYAGKLADGTDPALSPDGTKVAFVSRQGQISVVPAHPGNTPPAPTQVSFGLVAPTHLVWSADATHIEFETASGVSSVSATVAPHATSNPVIPVSPVHGAPAVQPMRTLSVVEAADTDPVATAVAFSKQTWVDQPVFMPSQRRNLAYGAVIVSTADPQAAMPYLSGVGGGPVLFTAPGALDPRTQAELRRSLGTVPPPGGNGPVVYLVGNQSMISANVENAITAMGYEPKRTTALDPAAIVPVSGYPGNQVAPQFAGAVFVQSADDTEALFLNPSGDYQDVRLLAVGGVLSSAQRSFLNQIGASTQVFALDAGAQTALAAAWPGKHNLNPTTATSAGFRQQFDGNLPAGRVIVADRTSPAALNLAATIAASSGGADVLAVDSKAGLDPDLRTWLEKSAGSITSVVIVGPGTSFAANTEHAIADALSGPVGYATEAP